MGCHPANRLAASPTDAERSAIGAAASEMVRTQDGVNVAVTVDAVLDSFTLAVERE